MNKFIIIAFIFTFILSDVSAKKKLYKWVDENGRVSYSDQVPPDQMKKAHDELNSQGVVVEKIQKIKTLEERKQEREERLRQIESEKQAVVLEQKRINIIKAYTNEAEIIRLKEERLAALERNIEQANTSLKFQKLSRSQLLEMAAGDERSGKKITKERQSRIKGVEEKIKNQIEFIEVKHAEVDKVKAKFDNDLKVYREATQGK